jgi:penicillin amidase
MSRGKRIFLISAGIIVLVLFIGIIYIRSLSRRGLPEYDGRVVLTGITDEVVVYRDRYAVPHIYAKNELDLYRTVGYCMAQDRLWQMDLIRRATTGKLSEIFGEELVETDLLLRALRIPEKSRRILSRSDKSLNEGIEAFADGVNQYIKIHRDNLPVEFSILGYIPEDWKPEHSVNAIGYMAWDLTMPWNTEIAHYKIMQKVGKEMYREIVPNVPGFTTYVYPDFAEELNELHLRDILLTHSRILRDLGLTVFSGSNNWAVSGKKSVTGKPIFANDMHLGLSAPGIWYQMHYVVEGKLNVTGLALPCQPSIVAGHNEHIAWGFTNVMVDDMDFYLEKINPDNPDEYLYRGRWRPMKVQKEIILIKGGKKAEREIRFTHQGPIITPFKRIKGKVISMHWIGNEYSDELRTVYLLNRAKNWEDFKNAVKTFISVSQNVIYTDSAGNTGLYCSAGIPIRKKGDGISIYPGWTDEYEWKGIVPFEKRPHSYNPKSGFVSSANNKTVGNSYPYYISHWFDLPHRIDRIREMLTEKGKLSVDDFKRMHVDHRSKLVEELKGDIIAAIQKDTTLTAIEKSSFEILSKWDGVMRKEGSAPAIFERLYITLIKNAFADELGEELYLEFISQRIVPKYAMKQIWKRESSKWWDDVATVDKEETFTDIVQKSFRETVAWLRGELGSEPENWKWGTIHTLTLKHPMGSVAILDFLFNLNRGPYEVGGSFHTVSPYSYSFKNPFGVTDGASHRHIFVPSKWDDSLTVIPTGNSGIPASDYYCDQTELYVNGEYHHDYFSRELVEKNARYRMVISGK